MISMMLVDDQDLVRLGLRTLFDAEDGFEVVAEAADGLAAVKEARHHRPAVILMDIRMPGIDGLDATRRIAADETLADVKIIVLTTFEHDNYVFEALRSGANGFLLKSTPPTTLVEAVRTVADGAALLSPTVTRTLIREFVEIAPRTVTPHPRLEHLTEREREIVGLVAQGMSNQEIADHLVLSPATARTHVSRAMIKLGARDRAQLVVFAYQSGLA
ncbi:response regulator transcription factor [Qaidamihabitans albus]|uniref:response regulator transcription factor n=1 Tax=Qaidamihabitans albus TaxID=2795733 RepID=UPI0018F22519|nr:response regulator transcription factor [Qaidamihabitans albus]